MQFMSSNMQVRLYGLSTLFVAILMLAPASAIAQQDAGAPSQQPEQQSEPPMEEREMGWIHGRVIGPTGALQNGGTVSLSTDGGVTLRYNFTVNPKGEYSGQAPLGEYTLVYRTPETPQGKVTDFIQGVVVLPGKDQAQDVDMTRQEYLDRLSPEQQEQLQRLKLVNNQANVDSRMIDAINADLQSANQDFEDAFNARAAAIQTLGSTASASDISSAADEIRLSKYSEIESLMSKATTEMPGEASLWVYLGRAQVALKDYLDAETSFQKAVDLVSKAGNRDPLLAGAANAGLGEVYARILMVDEAHASVAAAAKADPANAARYLRNLAVVFFQEKNAPAQIDAADEAIRANPQDAILYFIKAQGLAATAPIDPDTGKIKLPPECLAAFGKYLELAPSGDYSAQVTAILRQSSEDAAAASPHPPAEK